MDISSFPVPECKEGDRYAIGIRKQGEAIHYKAWAPHENRLRLQHQDQ